MENWTNANKILILDQKESSKKELEALTLVELCLSGIVPPYNSTIEPTEDFMKLINLLRNGASLNCVADLNTPLIAAMRTDNLTLAKALYRYGAKINYKHSSMTDDAVWEAIKTKKYEFLEYFISNRCILERNTITTITPVSVDPNNPTEISEPIVITNIQTPLIYATIASDEKAVEILLKHHNIKVNERGENGNTALHFNVAKNPQTSEDTAIGLMLVAAGADSKSRNLDGLSVEELAADPNARSMLLAANLERVVPNKDVEIIVENDQEIVVDVKPKKKKKI